MARWLNLALLLTIGILLIATLSLPLGRNDGEAGPEVWGFHLTLIFFFSGAWLLLRLGFGYVQKSVADHTAKLSQARRQLKQEVQARQQSEQRLYTLAQSAHDLICVWEVATQKWSYCNHPETMHQQGWQLPSYGDLLAHIHPDDLARVQASRNLRERMTTFPQAPLTYRVRLGGDDAPWLSVREQVLAVDTAKRPAQIVVAIHQDLHEHDPTNAEAAGAPEPAGAVIAPEAVPAHLGEQLRQAQADAEAAARAKSEFLANISHELRTPLNGVVGMTNLLQATDLNDEQRYYVDTIRHSSDTLLTIINDILDISKAESGRLGVEYHPLALHRTIEEALDLLAPKAAERAVEFVYAIDESVPSAILGDSSRLRQVLVNLVSNAIKFTDQGEIVVTVDATPMDDQQVELHFAIRDTGIGIAAAQLERLFQPFSQADTSNTRDYGGAGLGLVISKRLCELMGGHIWVESELHVGSTFHFTIAAPVIVAATDEERQARYSPHPALDGRTVLVVDDNQTVRQHLQQTLARWGMTVIQAASTDEALALMDKKTHRRKAAHVDMAIVDLHLPGMAGLTLAKELRKLDATLPIVMTSALGMPMYAAGDQRSLYDMPVVMPAAQRPNTTGRSDQRAAVRQLGVQSILVKPIKPLALRATLLEYFDLEIDTLEPSQSPGGLAHQATTDVAQEESMDIAMAQRHPLRILVAEDNLVNQKVALRMLKRLGYEADVANSGLEAVEAVQRQPYDVILMDVQMPGMDGLDATRQIRQLLSATRQPHIIAMTAAVMHVDRAQCLAVGMNDFMTKPTSLEALAHALGQCVPVSS